MWYLNFSQYLRYETTWAGPAFRCGCHKTQDVTEVHFLKYNYKTNKCCCLVFKS